MSTIPLAEAARKLAVHPANLLLRLSKIAGSLSDCWPDIDEGFVDTIRQLDGDFPNDPDQEPDENESAAGVGTVPVRQLPISADAAEVLNKLERRKHWKHHTVHRDTIRNVFCQGIADVDTAIHELQEIGFLVKEGGKTVYSLNLDKKAEIENILSQVRST